MKEHSVPKKLTTCRDAIAQLSGNTRPDFSIVKLEEGKAISQHLHGKISDSSSPIGKDETLGSDEASSNSLNIAGELVKAREQAEDVQHRPGGYIAARNLQIRASGYTAPLHSSKSKLPLTTAQVHGLKDRLDHGCRASPVTYPYNLNVKTENGQILGATSSVHRTRKIERGIKRASTETTRITSGLNGLLSDAVTSMKTEGETFLQADGLSETRVHSKIDNQTVHAFQSLFSGEYTEKSTGARTIRQSGGKDRHSKVFTSKGPRDRRVRLSVSTAIQFYDVQDRLGYDQPSKAVDWLIKKAKSAIDELEALPELGLQKFVTAELNGAQSLRIPEPTSAALGVSAWRGCASFARNSNEAVTGANSLMRNGQGMNELVVQSASETSLLLNEDGIDSASPAAQQMQQKDDVPRSPGANSSMLQSIRLQDIPAVLNGGSTSAVAAGARQFVLPHHGSSNQSFLQSLIMLSPEQIHDFGCEISADWSAGETNNNKPCTSTLAACASIPRPDQRETDPFRQVASTLDQHELLSTSPAAFGDLVHGVNSGKATPSCTLFAPLNTVMTQSSHNVPYGSYMVHRASIPARIHGFEDFEGDQEAAFSTISET